MTKDGEYIIRPNNGKIADRPFSVLVMDKAMGGFVWCGDFSSHETAGRFIDARKARERHFSGLRERR